MGQHTGTRTAIKNLLNRVLSEPQTIEMKPVERMKEFSVGSAVILEPIDLSEICHFVAVQCTQDFLTGLTVALTNLGVTINAPTPVASESYLKGNPTGHTEEAGLN
jgi:hypothetical protein